MFNKKITFVVCLTILFCTVYASIIYYFDPYYQYHLPVQWLSISETAGEMYQNPGLLKQLEYDAVLVGSSMTENFKISEINDKFNVNSIKVSIGGSTTQNYIKELELAYKNQNIKTVFWGLDNYVFNKPYDDEYRKIPEYLLDDKVYNDVNYLLNKDVLFKDIRIWITQKFTNTIKPYDDLYNWSNGAVFSKENAMKDWDSLKIKGVKELSWYTDEHIKAICDFVNSHSETDFYIFFPPYSILNWKSIALNENNFNNSINAIKYSMEKLIELSNVHLYYFQNVDEIINNLDNYKDFSHYKPEINTWMLNEMNEDNYLVTEENYESIINDLYKYY